MSLKKVLEDSELLAGPTEDTVTVSFCGGPSISVTVLSEDPRGDALSSACSILRAFSAMRRCPNCGMYYLPEITHCLRCGHKLNDEEGGMEEI